MTPPVTVPSFIVVGAARSATTSLHYWLDQHPQITMSRVKEPNFFAFDQSVTPPAPWFDPHSSMVTKSVPDPEAYARLFAHADPDHATGDASPLYLYTRETPGQIAALAPDARLVAVVRNPIDRAWSHHLHIHRDTADEAVRTFREACATEMATGGRYEPYASGTHVLRMGRYDEQLQRYLDAGLGSHLLVLAYEPLVAAPDHHLSAVLEHVGVPAHPIDTGVQYNRAGVAGRGVRAGLEAAVRRAQPRLKASLPGPIVARLARVRARWDRPEEPPEIPADLRAELGEWFAPSVARLRTMGVVDVDHWTDWR